MRIANGTRDDDSRCWHALNAEEAVATVESGNLLQVAVVFWLPLGRMFHKVPFGFREVVARGIVGCLILWVEEVRKLVARRRERRLAFGGA